MSGSNSASLRAATERYREFNDSIETSSRVSQRDRRVDRARRVALDALRTWARANEATRELREIDLAVAADQLFAAEA
jgi:hypothetical protein